MSRVCVFLLARFENAAVVDSCLFAELGIYSQHNFVLVCYPASRISRAMKVSFTVVALASFFGAGVAFTATPSCSARANTALNMESSRRDVIASSFFFGGALLTAGAPPAFAKRPAYLTEPTEEFKESERQRAEFRRAQIIIKQKMQALLDKLSAEPNDEELLVRDLTDLKQLVTETGGMPLGIKKDDLVKQVRAKKAKGFWPTNVEIAYQSLINEIMFQQSPNKDKDDLNPL